MLDRPEIVCICGSTRFADAMRAANRDLTFAGVIVVAPGGADEPITDEQKTALDAPDVRRTSCPPNFRPLKLGSTVGRRTLSSHAAIVRSLRPRRPARCPVSCTRRLVDKRWSYGNVLRDGGVGTIEHTEQLTHLLFPKTAHEREQRPAPWTSASLRGTAPGDC